MTDPALDGPDAERAIAAALFDVPGPVVDGVHKALGHAYGGGSQYFSTYIVADHKP